MASKLSTIKMEFEIDSISSGAFWLPSFEAGSLITPINEIQGKHCLPSFSK